VSLIAIGTERAGEEIAERERGRGWKGLKDQMKKGGRAISPYFHRQRSERHPPANSRGK